MSKTGADIDENGENHTTITCPYCEQEITGDQVWLMAHGIACRKQWEVRQEQIQNNIQNRFKYDKN
jgi:hypothetical protein